MKWLLLLVLVLTGSCEMTREAPRAASAAVPERADMLLRKLALDVPADVARIAVRGAEPAAAPLAAAGAPAFVDTARSVGDASRALDCLTTAIYHEARSESDDGQRAVAQVVLNRVRDRAFPPSVCGVVYQGSNRRTGCQFSFTCDGSLRRRIDPASWARAEGIAADALAGAVYAPVGSATHYHTTAISPWWAPSLTQLGIVGAHVFYRWPLRLERALAFRQAYSGYEPLAPVAGTGVAATGWGSEQTSFGTETVSGVTIHRGFDEGDEPGEEAAPALRRAVATVHGVRIFHASVADDGEAHGVRIHRGVADQPSDSPTPIDARAASASFDTTG